MFIGSDTGTDHQIERPPEQLENEVLSDQDPPEMIQVNVAQESPLPFPQESQFRALDGIFQDRGNPPVADTGCLQFEGQDRIMFQVGAGPQPTSPVNKFMPTQLERSGLQQGQLGEPPAVVHSRVQAQQIRPPQDRPAGCLSVQNRPITLANVRERPTVSATVQNCTTTYSTVQGKFTRYATVQNLATGQEWPKLSSTVQSEPKASTTIQNRAAATVQSRLASSGIVRGRPRTVNPNSPAHQQIAQAATTCLNLSQNRDQLVKPQSVAQPTTTVPPGKSQSLEDQGNPNPSVDCPMTTINDDQEVCLENNEIHWDSQTQHYPNLDDIPLGPGFVPQQGEAEQEQPQEPLASTSSASVNQNLETGQVDVDDDPGNTVLVCKPDA